LSHQNPASIPETQAWHTTETVRAGRAAAVGLFVAFSSSFCKVLLRHGKTAAFSCATKRFQTIYSSSVAINSLKIILTEFGIGTPLAVARSVERKSQPPF
jgi:hypothetical protein